MCVYIIYCVILLCNNKKHSLCQILIFSVHTGTGDLILRVPASVMSNHPTLTIITVAGLMID